MQDAEDLNFVEFAKFKFDTGGLEVRKRILATLGSNLILKDKKLTIDMENALLPMQDISKEVAAIHERLEPGKKLMKQEDFERLYVESPRVLGGLDEVRTSLQEVLERSQFAVVRSW